MASTPDAPRVPGLGSHAAGSLAELYRALGALVEAPGQPQRQLARLLDLPGEPTSADHTTVFVLNLYPYASVHLGAEGMLGGEARDRVAGFWRALGMAPPNEPDHLSALLGLLAALEERRSQEDDPAQRALLDQAFQALLREHLLPWLPPYLRRVEELADPCYARWAALLGEALEHAAASGTEPDTEELPLHLRALPPLPDPRETEEGGGETLLRALLASARSGMILTRFDLARAGRELGLGIRMGERAYVLKALLGQDAPATLRWLAGEARRQAEGHTSVHSNVTLAFWRDRALAAASLLDALASAEAHIDPTTPEAGAEPNTEGHHA